MNAPAYITHIAAAALIAGLLLLFAGCEKEKPQKEETHNPLCGTTWVKYGLIEHIYYDNYETDTIIEPYYKDTFHFLTDTEVLIREEPYSYMILRDTLIKFYNKNGRMINSNVWHFIDEHNIMIKGWINPFSIAWEHNDILLKKIDYEN